jgi:hypothetical protein
VEGHTSPTKRKRKARHIGERKYKKETIFHSHLSDLGARIYLAEYLRLPIIKYF